MSPDEQAMLDKYGDRLLMKHGVPNGIFGRFTDRQLARWARKWAWENRAMNCNLEFGDYELGRFVAIIGDE